MHPTNPVGCCVIRAYSFSEAGGHPVNEDAFLIQHSPTNLEEYCVCMADGQGGRAGGAAAARLACSTAIAFSGSASWLDKLTRADLAVAADAAAGFTTLIGFEVRGEVVVGASCGDSAVLALCGTGERTELTLNQFKNPPVGSGEATFVPFELELVRPWKLLAITDGVWKYVGWNRIDELVKNYRGEELLAVLQKAARLPGSGQFQDDFTVVLLEAE
jgi:hypothetical protein